MWLLRWLGISLGAFSLFNLAVGLREFGVSPVLLNVLEWYQRVFHPLVGMFKPLVAWLMRELQFGDLPENWQDGFIVYVLISAGLGRSLFRTLPISDAKKSGALLVFIMLLMPVFWPLVLWKIIDGDSERGILLSRDGELVPWAIEIAKAVAAFIVLLLINAGLPS